MKHTRRNSKKGFTLVEIMIVVVIIGLLAAMAIPAFNRVRENSVASRMDNDARQLAAAAQQYFLEMNASSVSHGYDLTSGAIPNSSPLHAYVKQLGKQYTIEPASLTTTGNFTIAHPLVNSGANVTYNAEGQRN